MIPLRRSTWLALLVVLLACGDDAENADGGLDAGMTAMTIPRPTRYMATLVPATSTDAAVYIAEPHEVSLLDENGNSLDPPVSTTSGPEGQVALELPANAVSIYVVGVGPEGESSSTYDTVLVSYNWTSPEPLLRISSAGTLKFVETSAKFEARSDRAAMAGNVYWTKDHVRQGWVGCAKIFIDGATGPDEDQAQRYVGQSLVPEPLAMQSQTRGFGAFYFGNVKIGLHTIRVSLDDGSSFAAQKGFFVGRPRSGAQSPTKAIYYQFAIDIEAPTDPTPADCPL